MASRLSLFALALVGACALAGCSGGPPLGTVEGVVTLDGAPLPGAEIQFQPVGEGTVSIARTNDQGHYVLRYTEKRDGAMIGEHTVSISTYGSRWDDAAHRSVEIPERVPAKYRKEPLKREVKAGHQTIDFPLES